MDHISYGKSPDSNYLTIDFSRYFIKQLCVIVLK